VTVPKPVRAWVADAESTHGGATIDEWFPPEFDWRALCADLPSIVERLGGTFAKSTAPAAKARLEELGQAAFRGAYVSALALLAGYDAEADPDAALDRLVASVEDDEERESLTVLLGGLDEMEQAIGGAGKRVPGAPYETALEAAAAVVEPVRELLLEGLEPARRSVVNLGGPSAAVEKALSGVVTVAVCVAAIRHRAAALADEARGIPALRIDFEALESALGG
jgi:hypothetical protein